MPLSLIKAELTYRGSSLTSELEEFKIKVLTREFEEGNSYPQVWHVGCYQQYPALFDSDTIYDSARGGFAGILNHLSAQYIRFKAPDAPDALMSLMPLMPLMPLMSLMPLTPLMP